MLKPWPAKKVNIDVGEDHQYHGQIQDTMVIKPAEREASKKKALEAALPSLKDEGKAKIQRTKSKS
jgi:hypothetical protein